MHVNRSVLFVGDGGDVQTLKRVLNSSGVELHARVRQASVKMPLPLRHLQYIRLAIHAVIFRKHHDAVFIWQQYVGLYYYLVSVTCPFYRRRPCCVYYIISNTKPRSIAARIKRFLMIRMFRSGYIDRAVFLSRSDALFEEAPPEKRILLSTYTERSSFIDERLASGLTRLESDYFSGGFSNRDYSALRRLAERMPDKAFSVACLPKDLDLLRPLPPNMLVDCDAYGDAFEEYVLSAKAVILPIKDPNITSGQIVCLRAMQAGKPVFMTRSNFMEEWLGDIVPLRFFVTYDDLEQLRLLLTGLTDSDLLELGLEARKYYLQKCDEESFYRGLADIIEALLK